MQTNCHPKQVWAMLPKVPNEVPAKVIKAKQSSAKKAKLSPEQQQEQEQEEVTAVIC